MQYRIGTRGSKLALVQTEWVKEQLQHAFPEDSFEVVIIKTKGDLIQNISLQKNSDSGFFVREIESQLKEKQIDFAVHSMKDMPAIVEEGLTFSRTWKRADNRDALVLNTATCLEEVPLGGTIATGSIRRTLQLKAIRPDLKIVDIRGNVDTRIRKMKEQNLDGLVLAAAGLKRLGKEDCISCILSTEEVLPSPAQGALAIELRESDVELKTKLDSLFDETSDAEIQAERGFLAYMEGSCKQPLGACCKKKESGTYGMKVLYGKEQSTTLYTAEVEAEDPKTCAKLAAEAIWSQLDGKCTLIGAGPGDPGLLSVKGKAALEQADVLVYDRLVSSDLVNLVPDRCKKIYVGKENHHHTLKQAEINALLVHYTSHGLQVVRLKGGDPYVFGRGGEEVEELRKQGCAFEVIPGITSAIAALNYAGIPITHRGVSMGFHVLTAHDQTDSLSNLKFDELAKETDETLVFLMGLSKLQEITEGLRNAGMDSSTPCAVISNGTNPNQVNVFGTLKDIVSTVQSSKAVSPAIIVVGNTVAMHETLDYISARPLHGTRVFVPKIGMGESGLANALKEAGALVEEVTTGQIQAQIDPEFLTKLKNATRLVFTSRNGVECFMKQLMDSSLDARALSGKQLCVIGSETANALARYHLLADEMPKSADSKTLLGYLKDIVKSEDRVLCVRGQEGFDLAKELADSCATETMVVYTNQEIPMEEIEYSDIDLICFTSGSSAKRVLNQKPKLNASCRLISIGPACSKVIREFGYEPIEARIHTYQGMMEVILNQEL